MVYVCSENAECVMGFQLRNQIVVEISDVELAFYMLGEYITVYNSQ